MKIVIVEKAGCAYWRDGDDIIFAPMERDGSFDTEQEDSGVVENWDDMEEWIKPHVEKALGF